MAPVHRHGDLISVWTHGHLRGNGFGGDRAEKRSARNGPELHKAVPPGAHQGMAVGEETQALQEGLVSKGAGRTGSRAGEPGKSRKGPRGYQTHQASARQPPAIRAALNSGDAGSFSGLLRRQGEAENPVLKSLFQRLATLAGNRSLTVAALFVRGYHGRVSSLPSGVRRSFQ